MRKSERPEVPAGGPARTPDRRDESPEESRRQWLEFFARCEEAANNAADSDAEVEEAA